VKRWYVVLGLALAPVLLAQSGRELFEQAPPHIDQALRARIDLFYQSHVDGKFRQADTVVHEDSKDAFFVAHKEQYKGFEILRIIYSEDFTEARAVIGLKTDFVMMGFGSQEVTVPITSFWKWDEGEWWWYAPRPGDGVETAFGTMRAGDASQTEEVRNQIANIDFASAEKQIMSSVKLDKAEATLSSHEPSSDEIVVTNGMPGQISLRLRSESVQGYEASLDRETLAAGEQAKITFRINPSDRAQKPSLSAEVTVLPANYVIPITVRFLPPPEDAINPNAN